MTQIRPQIKFFLRTTAIVNRTEEHYSQKELIFGNVGDWVIYISNHSFLDECPLIVPRPHKDEDMIRQAQNIYQEKGWDLNYTIDLPLDSKSFVARIEYRSAEVIYVGEPLTTFCTCIELHHKKYGWETIKEREIELKKGKKWWFFKTKNFVRCEDCHLRGD